MDAWMTTVMTIEHSKKLVVTLGGPFIISNSQNELPFAVLGV